jgi:ribonuclease-3
MFLEKLSRSEKKKLKELEKRLGARFWKKELLRRGLTHKSYANEKRWEATYHNERLEFLGDAVLELVVSHVLMELYPEAPEGELSKLRAAMVNEKTLASLARSLGIGEQLYLGKGEEMGQGREKSSLLSDAYEAILGALYLDRGFKKAFKVVRRHAESLMAQVNDEGFYKDYKTLLQEASQNRFKMVPRYRLVEELGPDHDKTFKIDILINKEVYGVGTGKSKKEAEQNAAREALEALEKRSEG